jgi:hypothetical protein
MIAGIVGSEAAKFTILTEALAKKAILEILIKPEVTGLSSGACHLGGIDIWAEEICDTLGKPKYIFAPKTFDWSTGFKPRNMQIGDKSDIVYCITVDKLPSSYTGMRFPQCYHCKTDTHVKSGGCWTAKYAQKLGKKAEWIIIHGNN